MVLKSSLCQSCGRAYGGCSWSRNFAPVEGWEAEKTHFHNKSEDYDSYMVTKCPLYKDDYPLEAWPDADAVDILLRAIIHQAVLDRRRLVSERPEDYQKYEKLVENEIEIREIDKFFMSGGYGLFDPMRGKRLLYGEHTGNKKEMRYLRTSAGLRNSLVAKLKQAIEDIKKDPCEVCKKGECERCENYSRFRYARKI